jgi:hypothetical protein
MQNSQINLELERNKAAAAAVFAQAEEAEGEYGIPVDPDLADFMGAFREDALAPEDL